MSENTYNCSIEDFVLNWVERNGIPDCPRGRSPEQIYRSYIEEETRNSTISQYVYREVLRSLIHEFGNFYYTDGDNKLKRIKAMHATPERTIGKMFKEQNIVLPVITLSLLQSENDDSKRRYDSIVIQRPSWNEDTQRAERIISLADVPVKVSYGINLWTKYMHDLDQITQNIRVRFNPSIKVKTSFSDNIKCFLASETNSGSLTSADQEDRLLRKTFNTTLEMYLPSPRFRITNTGKIERLESELWVS